MIYLHRQHRRWRQTMVEFHFPSFGICSLSPLTFCVGLHVPLNIIRSMNLSNLMHRFGCFGVEGQETDVVETLAKKDDPEVCAEKNAYNLRYLGLESHRFDGTCLRRADSNSSLLPSLTWICRSVIRFLLLC